jgi:hypothetical protein
MTPQEHTGDATIAIYCEGKIPFAGRMLLIDHIFDHSMKRAEI